MRSDFLPFSRPSITDGEITAVGEVLRSGWVTTGPKAAEFEAAFRDYVGCPHAVALSSAIRYCVKYRKRVVFPSTSEVYGMCEEDEFDEDNSKLVLGPIRMQRWIYSCCKQLLDRVIWA